MLLLMVKCHLTSNAQPLILFMHDTVYHAYYYITFIYTQCEMHCTFIGSRNPLSY